MTHNDHDHFTLSTGRKFYANNGIIGLSPHNNGVSEGYDGAVYVDEDEGEGWTTAERHELADYMISLWQQWKETK